MEKLSWDVIKSETIWVVKVDGYRRVGTYEQVAPIEGEEIDDMDIAGKQPDYLREFYDMYFAQDSLPFEERIYLLEEFYDKVYVAS